MGHNVSLFVGNASTKTTRKNTTYVNGRGRINAVLAAPSLLLIVTGSHPQQNQAVPKEHQLNAVGPHVPGRAGGTLSKFGCDTRTSKVTIICLRFFIAGVWPEDLLVARPVVDLYI